MQATPVTWWMLLEAGWRGDGRLKMLSGGDVLPPSLARRLLRCGSSLWNLYGPTETTVWSTMWEVRSDEAPVPIGRPVANTTLYALDKAWDPVELGNVGELFIGGAGVARGYAGRPDLTAERFVPDPFAAGGSRMYRTGDLVRHREGGELEFLGRLDRQVKVRGHRIELGEIETVLAEHPDVREAVAAVWEDPPGEAVEPLPAPSFVRFGR